MASVAASGGYWIAAPADLIVANPATLTGSIGVVHVSFSSSELMKKLGVAWEVLSTHKNSACEVGVQPLSEQAEGRYTAIIDEAYELFVDHVSTYRKRPKTEIEAAAKGRVWTGAQAYDRHLVDKLGGLHTAVQEACRLAKISSAEVVCWEHITEVENNPLAKILKAFGENAIRLCLSPFLSSLSSLFAVRRPAQLQAKMLELPS
jgi:protease-4